MRYSLWRRVVLGAILTGTVPGVLWELRYQLAAFFTLVGFTGLWMAAAIIWEDYAYKYRAVSESWEREAHKQRTMRIRGEL